MEKSIEAIEYEIKVNELKKIQNENRSWRVVSPTVVTVVVAFISIMGSFVASFVQKNNQLELDRMKFESDLIMSAVKANDIKAAKDNLSFLIEVGLIKNNANDLRRILSNNEIPLLKLNSYSGMNPVYTLSGTVLLSKPTDAINISVSLWPRTMDNSTASLKQTVNLNREGKFKVKDLEEIGYILQFKKGNKELKTILYTPNRKNSNDIRIFDLTKIL
jgi:hypothetical protein